MQKMEMHKKIEEIKTLVYRMSVLPEDCETLEEANMHAEKIVNLLDEIDNNQTGTPQTAEEMSDACDMVRNTVVSLILDPQMPRREKATEMIHRLTMDPEFVSTIKEQSFSNTDWLRTVLTCGKSISNVFLEFSDVVAAIIPEMTPCIGFDQKSVYHKHDVYEHTLAVVDGCQTDDFCTKMAAFLHDIGKPSVCTEDASGHRHFKGHAIASKKIAEKILYRLDFSGDEISVILELG